MFYTRSNGMRVPATVVGFAPDGLLHLEYFQDAVKVVNRQCKVESISFAIPSADSPPPSTRSPSPPPDDRGRSPSKSATPSPRAKPRAPKTTKRSREAGKASADVKIWDKYGPQRTKGCFMEFEVGAHDGAYKGRLHSHVPFIGRKTLTMRQKTYNDVHGYYRARVEHLFAHLWSWRVVRDIWLGSHQDLHANTRILLHFSQFMLRRQKRY